jgi:uncharacterized protein (DUF433 family)
MEYVEQRNGGYYVAGTRVSLDSVVYGFLRGESAEEIAYNFEALTVSQIEGAIAFYRANRETVALRKLTVGSRRRTPSLIFWLKSASAMNFSLAISRFTP